MMKMNLKKKIIVLSKLKVQMKNHLISRTKMNSQRSSQSKKLLQNLIISPINKALMVLHLNHRINSKKCNQSKIDNNLESVNKMNHLILLIIKMRI